VVFLLQMLAASGCFLADGFQDNVALKFSFCRVGDRVVLGLRVHNSSSRPIYPGAKQLTFLVNGREADPLIQINDSWRTKAILPGSPKGQYAYFSVSELAARLGVGEKTLQWKYSPVESNKIILDIMPDGGIREVHVECEDRVRRLAEATSAVGVKAQ